MPKSKMEAASWAACQRVLCFDIDGYDLFGQEFFSQIEIKKALRNIVAEKVEAGMVALQSIVAFVGLDWRFFFLGLCIRLHPNQQQDHIQVHYFGT